MITKLRYLLINLPEPSRATQKKTHTPPLGLWSIRATLRAMGQHIDICDMHIGDDIESFLGHEYDHIGISARFSIQHEEYLRVAKRVKGLSYVAAGGIHAMLAGPVDGVDEICHGPGESFYAPMLHSHQFPVFDEDEIRRYWDLKSPHDLQSKTDRWMSIETSRGCPGSCGFCGVKNLWGRCWNPFDIDDIETNLVYLRSMGIKELFIEDDNVSIDKNRFLRLIELFNRYGFAWSCPNGIQIKTILDPDVIEAIAHSGCWRLSLPFETGSERSAELMGVKWKWVDHGSASEFIDYLSSHGVQTCGFFIIGYPGETRDDVEATLEYANSLPLDQRNIYIATPYPGTRLFDDCIRNGWIKDWNYSDLLYTHGVVNTPWLKADEVAEIKRVDREKAILRRQAESQRSLKDG